MVISAENILEDINDKIRQREIFRLNRAFLVKALIIAATDVLVISYTNINLTNQVIEQFRTILKFVFSVDNEKGVVPTNFKSTTKEFSNMILEFVDNYTPIRNYLDQCIIGMRNISYNDEKKVYYEESYDTYSIYARMLDKVKKDTNEELKQNVLNSLGKYLKNNKFKLNLFKNRFFYGLMEDYKEISRLDSEIKFEYDFGDFTYEELISFCAALKIMADYYSFLVKKQPCPVIDDKTLVSGISKLANLSEDKVKIFLKYQTYDYEYQKDKLTLFQNFIKLDDNYYFYPITLSIGMLPTKMYKVIVDYNKEKYNKAISIIANLKERQMTEDIVEQLKKYDLSIELNKRIRKENTTLAEYDMLALDNKTNNLYIFEFKWYFMGDGEKEHKNVDDKIEKEIKHRKEKNKFIFDDPQNISDKYFDKIKINKIYEILISQNFSGSTKHDMCVIDFETLQRNIDKYDSFEELMNYFLNDDFRKSLKFDKKIFNTEIEGYKFSFYRIII